MMMLHRSASESAFSRTHKSPPPLGLVREDADAAEDGSFVLTSTPSVRTLPGRSSFTTPRRGSQQARDTSESTPSSSTSRLAGSQPRQPSLTSSSEHRQHRALDKTVSQQTVLSGSSTTAFSKTAWASEDSVDTTDARKGSKKSARSRGHLVLPPSPNDEGEGKYKSPWNARKETPLSPREYDKNHETVEARSPSSPNKRSQGSRTSQSVNPESPKKINNHHRYHPHNEKFPIVNSTNSPQCSSARSPLRENVFDFSTPPQSPLIPNASSVSSRDKRAAISNDTNTGEVTPPSRRGRKPSKEVLLEFPPVSNNNGRQPRRVAQQTERIKEEIRERPQDYHNHNHQVLRAAQSVPRLDAGRATTPTNSPDRSTRPHSVDARERGSPKSSKGRTCDFFFLFRWGKKKDKGKRYISADGEAEGDNSRHRSQRNGRHRSKTDNSESPSGSRDKHSRGRSRSKSKDKRPDSSSTEQRHRHHHSHRSHQEDRDNHHTRHHHHHRPSSSSASRPLRTPTGAGKSSPELQYRQYRHHHRREQEHQQHQRQQQHHSPDENRPPAQQYTPSRPKRERPTKSQHRRGRSGQAPTEDGRSFVSDGTVGLRHEDLPLHPSIAKTLLPAAKKTPSQTITGSYQKNTFVRAAGGGDQLRRGWKRSRSESPSNLRPSTANSGSNPNLAGESSTGCGEGNEGRERSQHSASRTDLDSNYHYTVSSTDQRYHHNDSHGASPGMSRSRSYPGFESHAAHYFNPNADTKVITDAEDFEYRPTDMSGPLHLSFCGCGFVGMYHLGVVSCLLQRGDTFLEHVERVTGASAGALMAAIMLCAPDKIEEVGEQFQSLARELRSRPLGALTPGYSFARALRLLLDEVLPEDAHLLVSGKLYISLTASASGGGRGGGGGSGEKGKKKNNELMTEFNSREELIEALVATSYIPLYAGLKMPVIRGKKYMDGGFSDNMPTFSSGRTITVSPFDGRSDIAPKAGQEAQKKAHFISLLNHDYQVNIRNMKKGAHSYFPPKRHVMQEYFDLGRYDASRFLIREGLYTIKLIHSAEKALYVSSV